MLSFWRRTALVDVFEAAAWAGIDCTQMLQMGLDRQGIAAVAMLVLQQIVKPSLHWCVCCRPIYSIGRQ